MGDTWPMNSLRANELVQWLFRDREFFVYPDKWTDSRADISADFK